MPLISSTYGKDNVKFLKVKKNPKDPKYQDVTEITAQVLLQGAFDASYTDADNASIVPTDTVKNTILVEAKTHDVWPMERFAAHLAQHFVGKYSHVSGLTVELTQLRWTRYAVNGKPHAHLFIRDSPEVRVCKLAYLRSGDYTLTSGIQGLTVLKSTGSMFYGFHQCDYTILKPTEDRILSTLVDATWNWDSKKLGPISSIDSHATAGLFDYGYDSARNTTLELFAIENSPSVQATMYNMSEKILATVPEIATVSYSLPNIHYILFDLKWKGIEQNDDLFYPSPHPNGLIKSTVGRTKAKL